MLVKDAIIAVDVAKSRLNNIMHELKQLDHQDYYEIDKNLIVAAYIEEIHAYIEEIHKAIR